MARKSAKAGTRSAAAGKRKQSKTASGVSRKTVNLRHVKSPNYSTIYADGSLVRISKGVMEINLVVDSPIISHEVAVQEEHGLRLTNEMRTEPARMEQAAIRMPVDSALQMALNIVDHISENMPEALKRVGIKVGDPRQERGKKK